MISVKTFHTFGLDAKVNNIIEIESIEQLDCLVGKKIGHDFILVGEGSNTVFLEDYDGDLVLIKTKGIKVDSCGESYLLDVAAGENWHSFVESTLQQGIYGLENLALIPGAVGACPVQNIGAYGVEVNQFILEVEYFDLTSGELKKLTNNECQFSYRDSIFKSSLKEHAIITRVLFAMPKAWSPVISYGELANLPEPTARAIFDKVIETRQAKLPDPKEVGNAGSFFKNPIISKEQVNKLLLTYPTMPNYPWSDSEIKVAAGWLIDQAGLKGYEFNGVAVHKNQALVLINKSGQGKSQDLVALIGEIQRVVKEKFDIELHPEVRLFASEGEVSFDQYYRDLNA